MISNAGSFAQCIIVDASAINQLPPRLQANHVRLLPPRPPVRAAMSVLNATINGSSFSMYTTPADFQSAQASCNLQGGHLAYFYSLQVRTTQLQACCLNVILHATMQ